MRILLVEDDPDLNDTLSFFLRQEGYAVDSCLDGEEALLYLREMCADVIILDRLLPGCSGMDLLARIRKNADPTPVMFLTALGTLQDKIEGLDQGADDYLVKPFEMKELSARIRSLLRRQVKGLETDAGEIRLGDLCWRGKKGELLGPAGSRTLSKRETELMDVFARNPGQVLGRGLLLNKVWGISGEVEDGNLDNYISFLRRRLKNVASGASIQTIRGIGYCFKMNEQDKQDKQGK
jgi:DNA-binding response OmpR family regulator